MLGMAFLHAQRQVTAVAFEDNPYKRYGGAWHYLATTENRYSPSNNRIPGAWCRPFLGKTLLLRSPAHGLACVAHGMSAVAEKTSIEFL